TIQLSFFELFGNTATDLLNDRVPITIVEDALGSIQVRNVTEETVTSPEDFLALIERGATLRRTVGTAKCDVSSRSHAVCRIRVINGRVPELPDGFLYLVDLAGSESASDQVHHDKDRIAESKEINKSLAVLKECIRNRVIAGTTGRHVHVPYRTSKLTVLLKAPFQLSSTQQCRTIVIANVSSNIADIKETLNTLRFIAPLKVAPTIKPPPPSRNDPGTWTNADLRKWVATLPPSCRVDAEFLCPIESGAQLCRLPEGVFLARCLLTPTMTPKLAKAVYLKLWDLLIAARDGK
ncbi:P-loop containing nucleoside triphosphate hydrolase protein, partial [Blyttiomyces helicus]